MEEIQNLEARVDELAKQLLIAQDARMIDIINDELDSIEEELYAIKFVNFVKMRLDQDY
jgi:hypothetical protein